MQYPCGSGWSYCNLAMMHFLQQHDSRCFIPLTPQQFTNELHCVFITEQLITLFTHFWLHLTFLLSCTLEQPWPVVPSPASRYPLSVINTVMWSEDTVHVHEPESRQKNEMLCVWERTECLQPYTGQEVSPCCSWPQVIHLTGLKYSLLYPIIEGANNSAVVTGNRSSQEVAWNTHFQHGFVPRTLRWRHSWRINRAGKRF